ncbi:MAG TPA: hypothetical protein VF181_11720 [Balneolaceae bacterium]
MMKLFRMESDNQTASPLRAIFFIVIVLLVIGSFFLQMSLGHCPVP